MKKVIFILSFLILISTSTSGVFAKRLLPYLKTTSTKPSTAATTTKGVISSVKFRGDRRAIISTFSNVNAFQSISYVLTYSGNGIPQGVTGNITPGENTTTREIIFGTCSNGICRYDRNITDAKFIITTTLNNGTKIRKTYVLKV